MKRLIQICMILCFILSAKAEKVLRVYEWKDLMSQHPIPNSEIVSLDGISVLKIQNTNVPGYLDISLLTITNQAIIKKALGISLEVKCEGAGVTNGNGRIGEYYTGIISMLETIPPYASGGDEITNVSKPPYYYGTMNWRRDDLNIDRQEIAGLPTQVELKLITQPHETFYIRPIKVLEVERANNGWPLPMSALAGILIGSIGGPFIGLCGALIGCLAGMGKARRFVLTTTKCLVALGIVLTVAGLVALVCKQPYAIWYPLVLLGGITTLVLSVNYYPIKRRYDELEIRRMTSMDATGR